MTTIERFQTPEEAHLFRLFLGDRGIEAQLLDEHTAQAIWLWIDAIGRIRLVVADEDAVEAHEALREYREIARRNPVPEQPARRWPLVLLLSIVLGVPFLLFGREQPDPPAS